MKHLLPFFLAAGTALLSSCNKISSAPDPVQSSEKVPLTITVGDASTKVLNPQNSIENAVRGIQILVFNQGGEIEAYASGDAADSFVVGVAAGEKTIWAVANSTQNFSAVTTLADFEKTTIDLKENSYSSTAGGFVLAGKVTAAISSQNNKVSIDIKHLTAKVIVDKISKEFKVEGLKGKKLSLMSIYLINAVDRCTLMGASAPSAWYNKLSNCDSQVSGLLSEAIIGTTLIGEDSPYCPEGGIAFYPFPNNSTSESSSSTWSPRKTMLVIEASMDGARYYYPVFLKSLEAGKVYEFTDITLTRRGSSDPYVPVSSEDISITVRVIDYVTGGSYTESI